MFRFAAKTVAATAALAAFVATSSAAVAGPPSLHLVKPPATTPYLVKPPAVQPPIQLPPQVTPPQITPQPQPQPQPTSQPDEVWALDENGNPVRVQ